MISKASHFVVGIFDSGLGGLTVVKEIRKLLPSVDIIYYIKLMFKKSQLIKYFHQKQCV